MSGSNMDTVSKLEDIPNIVLITSHHLDWKKLIKGIVKGEVTAQSSNDIVSCSSSNNDGDDGVPVMYKCRWEIKNKYYGASVGVVAMHPDNWQPHLPYIRRTSEAMLLYWDNTTEDAMTRLQVLYDELDGFQPNVCLLVCDSFDTSSAKQEAVEWCSHCLWELVELDELIDQDEDDDRLFDTRGVERIVEALHANSWTNLVLVSGTSKKNNSKNEEDPNPELLDKDPFLGVSSPPAAVHHANSEDGTYLSELDKFEDLYAKFSDLKVNASQLSREERLNYAEGVAYSFMNAMGDADDSDEDDPLIAGVDMHDNYLNTVLRFDKKVQSKYSDRKDSFRSSLSSDHYIILQENVGVSDCSGLPFDGFEANCYTTSFLLQQEQGDDRLAVELGFPSLSHPAEWSSWNSWRDPDPDLPLSPLRPLPLLPDCGFGDIRSYDDIELEFDAIQMDKRMKNMRDRKIIHQELNDVEDPHKKLKT